MKEMLVSVVVPVYNAERYLDRCVKSLAAQTWPHLEILLIDDGSPDRCPEICDEWAERDSRIRVIHKKNAGAGMARNTGIEAATGNSLIFVDSDDYLELTAVEKAYRVLTDNHAQAAVFGLTRVNDRGECYGQLIPVTEQTCYRGQQLRSEFLPDLIDQEHRAARSRNLALNRAAIFSMDLIRKLRWRFASERDVFSEDAYSLIRLYAQADSVAVLPEVLYYYCDNGASLTHTFREDQFQQIKKFHGACMDMAQQLALDRAVCLRIDGLFLAFSIAAMKQIAAADLPVRKRLQLFEQIIDDDKMQDILADPDCRYRSRSRMILFRAMRHRLHRLVYCFARLQVFRTGR